MDTNFCNSAAFPVVDVMSSVKENTRCNYGKVSTESLMCGFETYLGLFIVIKS
jgi:hypothetical protein